MKKRKVIRDTLIILIIIFTSYVVFSQGRTPSYPPEDNLEMLTSDSLKYWDRCDTEKGPGWQISRGGDILEYHYNESNIKERIEHNYHDYIRGRIKFFIHKDTLLLPEEKTMFLIKKITPITLILERLSGDFGFKFYCFTKSIDQQTSPRPYLGRF